MSHSGQNGCIGSECGGDIINGFLNPENHGGPSVSAVVTAMDASTAQHTTYQVSVAFEANHVDDVYALYGDGENHLIIPPAFQVPTPFGTSVGPQNPAFFAVQPDCEFDSFLTIVSTHAATTACHVCRLTRADLLPAGH